MAWQAKAGISSFDSEGKDERGRGVGRGINTKNDRSSAFLIGCEWKSTKNQE